MTTEEMNGLASIARKKAAIMAALKRFGKDAYNQNQKYKFPSAAKIFDVIRELMSEHGLVLFTSAIDGHQDPMQSKGGTAGLHTFVRYRMLWVDTDTGATLEDLWLSESDDYQDKGVSKSATLALKSYLLTTFIVSSGDEADDPDYDIGAQEAAKRNATSPKSRNTARQGATTSNGAQNGSQTANPPDGTIDHVLLKEVRVYVKEPETKHRYEFTTEDGRKVYEFSRDKFKELGWIEDTEWNELGTYAIKHAIPVAAKFNATDTGGWWNVETVAEVTF